MIAISLFVYILAVLEVVAASPLLTTASPALTNCRVVTFEITASAQNNDYGDDFNPNNATSINEFVNEALNSGTVNISGLTPVMESFSISAQYCVPVTSRPPTSIQVLLHGNTNNRKIWDGLGVRSLQDAGYSWQHYAATTGHATLALDMIGHGLSTLPDPNMIVQMPIEAAIVCQITKSLRTLRNPLGQSFEDVTFVGHSYGAITGVAAARISPNFANRMVLVGWSAFLPLPSPLLALQLTSASLVDSRFNNLPLGYLVASNESGSINTFFGGKFNSSVAAMNFELQDIITTGEGGSIVYGLEPAANFTGPVLAVAGENDILFCNTANGACADQLSKSAVFIPSSSRFETHVIPQTGHDFMLHSSSQITFEFIQNWLDNSQES